MLVARRALYGAVSKGALTLLIILLLAWALVGPTTCLGAGTDVRVLLVGSHAFGPSHWVSLESFLIENVLDFNCIPYDFFDIHADSLDQAALDAYGAVILECHALALGATEEERSLIASAMQAGSMVALVGAIRGDYTILNPTVYGSIGVASDGLGNLESNVHLTEQAANVYDFPGDGGFIVVGGEGGKHVGVAVSSLGGWSTYSNTNGASTAYGFEYALETFMKNAFGADARVTMPLISLRLDDTQTICAPRDQTLIDFIDANKHRIRASGYLVTDASAYQTADSARQADEQIISTWGSMSLHGKDHSSVGAEGENQDYLTQAGETSEAVDLLAAHFARYKPIKACPNNSWNEATLHAMSVNGIVYHSASLRSSDGYANLYKSVFGVESEMEREKMFARARGRFRCYPLSHTDATGTANVYSVDWLPVVDANTGPAMAGTLLKECGLDWWTPIVVGAHFYTPGPGGANANPGGWMGTMGAMMDLVDDDSHAWRRWADNYDLAYNLSRFERSLTVNSISVAGDAITYDLEADEPIEYLTLKAARDGWRVGSATINGGAYNYFGDDYVHLPEISGRVVVVVALTADSVGQAHVTHIDPSGTVQGARVRDGKLELMLGGEFDVGVAVARTSRVFMHGTTRVFSDGTERLVINAGETPRPAQTGLSATTVGGWVDFDIAVWDTSGEHRRVWHEVAEKTGITAQHEVGDLEPGTDYVVSAGDSLLGSLHSDSVGRIRFNFTHTCSTGTGRKDDRPLCRRGGEGPALLAEFASAYGCTLVTIEVVRDTACAAAIAGTVCTLEPGPAVRIIGTADRDDCGGRVRLVYEVLSECEIAAGIYDIRGRAVTRLGSKRYAPGIHTLEWDGLDEAGRPVGPGIFFFRLDTPAQHLTHKVVSVR